MGTGALLFLFFAKEFLCTSLFSSYEMCPTVANKLQQKRLRSLS